MPKTLLAVDDSVTMRKALEITFSADDFRVVTAEGSQAAAAKASDADAIVIDTVLGSEDGYALAKQLRAQRPGAAIILLASRYAPYDAARGKDAGADDFADKPFDTQALIDKVKKALEARASGVGAAPAAAAAGAPYRAPAPPVPSPAASPQPAAAMPKPTQQSLGEARAAALSPQAPARPAPPAPGSGPAVSRGPLPPQPSAAPRPPAPAPVAAAPVHAPAPVVHAAPAPVAHAPAAAGHAGAAVAAANGQLAGKLSGLGLSQAQVEGVLALSRELVEQVVWEVVPTLAETLIKEEIARLTRE